jgi:chromosome segregation ATPase
VDAEAAVQEAQAVLSRLRSSKAELQRELAAAVAQRDGLHAQLEDARARLGARLGEVARVEAERAAAERERATVDGALERTRAYVTNLSYEQRAARAAYARCAEELTSITDHVRRLVEAAARNRSENRPRRSAPDDPDR